MSDWTIRQFLPIDEAQVIALWNKYNMLVPWNDPHTDILAKIAFQPQLFLVAEQEGQIVAVAMGGYDGHRGSLNYFCSDRLGAGKALLDELERKLKELGCPKLNLQVRETNTGVVKYYQKLGYKRDPVIQFGKRLDGK